MRLWVLFLVLTGTISGDDGKSVQSSLSAYTGNLVKALVKANWVMQKLIYNEIESSQAYISDLLLQRVIYSRGQHNYEVKSLLEKLKDEFIKMIDITTECTATEGVVWIAHRTLRAAENYRELSMRADVMEVCGYYNSEELNKLCADITKRYDAAVKRVEDNVTKVVAKIDTTYDSTMVCLRYRYNSLLKSLENKIF